MMMIQKTIEFLLDSLLLSSSSSFPLDFFLFPSSTLSSFSFPLLHFLPSPFLIFFSLLSLSFLLFSSSPLLHYLLFFFLSSSTLSFLYFLIFSSSTLSPPNPSFLKKWFPIFGILFYLFLHSPKKMISNKKKNLDHFLLKKKLIIITP